MPCINNYRLIQVPLSSRRADLLYLPRLRCYKRSMDVAFLIRQRLTALGLDQRDLASAVQVTESYISQLLARKKLLPAHGRTDIYERIARVLQLPPGELVRLASEQRLLELKKRVGELPGPLFGEFRELVLRKCHSARRDEVRLAFEREAFGALERLISRALLESAQGIAREELRNENWLRAAAQLTGRSFEQMRAAVLEFLEADLLQIGAEACLTFLDPIIDSWNIDLATFEAEIFFNPRMAPGSVKRFAYAEITSGAPPKQPGFTEFLENRIMSNDATPGELAVLERLRFGARQPTAMYYYRELQSLRDPLHFVSDTEKSGNG